MLFGYWPAHALLPIALLAIPAVLYASLCDWLGLLRIMARYRPRSFFLFFFNPVLVGACMLSGAWSAGALLLFDLI